MTGLTPEIIEKMQKEDPWFLSENGLLCMFFDDPTINIEIAELETVNPMYENSAALHCFLGAQYGKLSEELDRDLKLHIITQKLEKKGKKYLLDYRNKSITEVRGSLPHKGNDLGENIKLSTDYLEVWSIDNHLGFSNAHEERYHLLKSLELSENNPTVFEHFINPVAAVYMASIGLRNVALFELAKKSKNSPLPDEYSDNILATAYQNARKRSGMEINEKLVI